MVESSTNSFVLMSFTTSSMVVPLFPQASVDRFTVVSLIVVRRCAATFSRWVYVGNATDEGGSEYAQASGVTTHTQSPLVALPHFD